jgi:lipid A 3-O-deacylase
MNIMFIEKFKCAAIVALTLSVLASSGSALAEVEWISFTGDNDSFVGNDNGYTNGLFVSWYDTPEGKKAEPGFLARAMLWSLPDSSSYTTDFNIGTVGQTMTTPDDIEQDPPILPPDSLPYGGLLFYTDTLLRVQETHADRIAVTIGVVGEYSFAEESQKFVHKIIDSAEPCCWDTQLANEIVFQFSRGRVWKTWVSDSGNADFILGADAELGTLASSVGAQFMIRYGAELKKSYASALLTHSRTTNPFVTRGGWFVFTGARASYLANNIFLDGSKSYDDDYEKIDYDPEMISVTAGLAYAWKKVSLTFAMNNLNVLSNNEGDPDAEFTKYGTLTVAWKLD